MKSALGVLSCNCQPSLGSTTFNADQVIGKTLMAKKNIALKNLPQDAAPTVATVAPGQPVGSVYSYVNPAPGRTNLYWQITSSGKAYWVKHEIGAFDVSNLKVQGVKTSEQVLAEKRAIEEKENDPVLYYFKKIGLPIALGVGVVYLIGTLGKTYLTTQIKN